MLLLVRGRKSKSRELSMAIECDLILSIWVSSQVSVRATQVRFRDRVRGWTRERIRFRIKVSVLGSVWIRTSGPWTQ